MDIDKTLERYILSEYEEEPFPYEWSEQDLYEQIRKLVNAYNGGCLSIPSIPSKYKRLQKRYESLHSDFLDLVMLYYEHCGELPRQFDYLAAFVGANISKEVENDTEW
jgi:hypothetical protein